MDIYSGGISFNVDFIWTNLRVPLFSKNNFFYNSTSGLDYSKLITTTTAIYLEL